MAIVGALFRRFWPKSHSVSKQASINDSGNALTVVESPGAISVLAPMSDSPIAAGQNISQSIEVHHHYQQGGPSQELLHTKPTPAEIFDELESVMPFDLQHSREKYRGLSVVCKVTFRAITAQDAGWSVFNKFLEGSCPSVGFNLSSVPPDLKTAKAGSTLWVRGNISRVWELGIYLESDPTILRVERS